jgi:hypothetical protein
MVIKSTFVHSGWSYGKGDDQYDNESIGSTRTVVYLEKLMENSSRNKKNGTVGIMCSRNNDKHKHTNEEGWTTVDAQSNRKPKTTNNKQALFESIISTINMDLTTVKKGAPEAKIDSPMRENRCTLPEEIKTQEEEDKTTKEQRKQKYKQKQKVAVAVSTSEEADRKPTTPTKKTRITKNKGYKKDNTNTMYSDKDTRDNKGQEKERMDKKQECERKSEITTTSKGEESTDASETTDTGKNYRKEIRMKQTKKRRKTIRIEITIVHETKMTTARTLTTRITMEKKVTRTKTEKEQTKQE